MLVSVDFFISFQETTAITGRSNVYFGGTITIQNGRYIGGDAMIIAQQHNTYLPKTCVHSTPWFLQNSGVQLKYREPFFVRTLALTSHCPPEMPKSRRHRAVHSPAEHDESNPPIQYIARHGIAPATLLHTCPSQSHIVL